MSASSFDLISAKLPDHVNSFGETIEIDLNSLTGSANMTSSSGLLTDQSAQIMFKTAVNIPLKCEHAAE